MLGPVAIESNCKTAIAYLSTDNWIAPEGTTHE